jgi:hypothetical protein
MARNPRTKLAAVLAAVVATLGMAAVSPASAAHASGGKVVQRMANSHEYCC